MALPKKYDFNDYDNYLTDPNPTTSAEAQDYFRNMDMLVTAMVDTFLWQPETNYKNGDVVKSPSMPNGAEAVCVAENGGKSSNVEPQWGNVGGENIADGTCFWKLRWEHWSKDVEQITDLTTGATNRLPNTSYAVGNVVYNRSNLSVAIKCTQAGTTSNSELDISGKVVGASVTDGTCVWSVVSRDLSKEVKNNADNFENYLPLSGGVMQGELSVRSNLRVLPEHYNHDKATYEGGQIILENGDEEYPQKAIIDNFKGQARVHLATGDNLEEVLDSSGVIEAVVTRISGCIRYTSGLQICWGASIINRSGLRITFPLPFVSKNAYTVKFSPKTTTAIDVVIGYNNDAANSFFAVANGEIGADWLAIGWWKE